MDCDEALVLLAAREVRTLSHREEAQLSSHAEGCETCRVVRATDDDEGWWIMRASGDPVDEPVIPTVNPNVFVIGDEVAAGGMGRVLRARDRRLGREVAIKESLEPGMHARFEREALITARLQHPAIVPIYEAGMWPDGTRFYTMRLVPGQTLAGAIAEAGSPQERLALLRHVIAATEAVAHAHSHRIIHRDLKPGNILVGELGETVVIDWGIARRLDHDDELDPAVSLPVLDHQLTRVGSVLGTPGFMAPEQARGESLDERADVFALGTILYTLIAGEAPYAQHEDVAKLLAQTGREPAPSIDFVAAESPKDLRAIVAKAMAFDPAERYPTAREMADDLRRFETGQLIARPYGTSELIARWVRRHKAAVSIGLLALVTLAVVTVVFVRGLAEARDLAEDKQTEAEAARAIADRERAASEAALARSLEDQGREAYLAGSTDRSLVLLAEAQRRGRDTPALRHLLAAVTRERGLVRWRRQLPDLKRTIAVAITDREMIVASDDKVRSWGEDPRDKHKVRLVRDATSAVVLPNGADIVVAGPREVSRHRLPTETMRWSVAVEVDARARLAVSEDRVAIATSNALLVLDLATGTELARLPFPNATSYAFSADGRRFAAATADGRLQLWDERFAQVASWTAREAVTQLVVLDGDRVVTAGASSVVLWTRGANPRELGRNFKLPKLQLAPATRLVAAGDNLGAIVIWTFDGEEVGSSSRHDAIHALAFSPDGRQLAACDAVRTIVYDSHALAPITELATPEAKQIAWRADGSQLAISGDFELLRVDRPIGIVRQRVPATHALLAGPSWVTIEPAQSVVRSIATGEVLGRFGGLEPRSSEGLAGSTDGRRMMIAGTSSMHDDVQIVSLPDGTTTRIAGASRARLSLDGKHVVVFDDDDRGGRLRVIGPAGASLAERRYPLTEPRTFEIAPDGTLLVLRGHGCDVLDLETLATKTRIEVPFAPTAIAFSRRGDRLAMIGGLDDTTTLVVYELATWTQVARFDIRKTLRQSWLANDGTIAVHVTSGEIEVYRPATSTPALVVSHVAPGAAALSPDGSRVLVGRTHGELEIWDAGGALLEVHRAHRAAIEKVEWVDDDRFATRGKDATATIWHLPRIRWSAAEIAALTADLPWRVEAGGLVRR